MGLQEDWVNNIFGSKPLKKKISKPRTPSKKKDSLVIVSRTEAIITCGNFKAVVKKAPDGVMCYITEEGEDHTFCGEIVSGKIVDSPRLADTKDLDEFSKPFEVFLRRGEFKNWLSST